MVGAMLIFAIPDGLWPYSYYQVLRWVVMITGILLACEAATTDKMGWVWAIAILAILFNPIIPFYFGKEIWIYLDLISAGIIFSYAVVGRKKIHSA